MNLFFLPKTNEFIVLLISYYTIRLVWSKKIIYRILLEKAKLMIEISEEKIEIHR